jgi:hypothetical protein
MYRSRKNRFRIVVMNGGRFEIDLLAVIGGACTADDGYMRVRDSTG